MNYFKIMNRYLKANIFYVMTFFALIYFIRYLAILAKAKGELKQLYPECMEMDYWRNFIIFVSVWITVGSLKFACYQLSKKLLSRKLDIDEDPANSIKKH